MARASSDTVEDEWLAGVRARDVSDTMATRLLKAAIKNGLFGSSQERLRVGRFSLLELIAMGSMGEVYAAYDEQLDRKVAIKLVRPDLGRRSERAAQRLLREAQTLARLSHPNVIHVYEAGMVDNRVHIAMEYIRGTTLRTWIAEQAGQPERIRWRLILDKLVAAARGLHAAHRAGLVHRDFKPDNVMVGSDGRVLVIDFGLAGLDWRENDAEETVADAAADDPFELVQDLDENATKSQSHPLERMVRLTITGAIMGTPAYMSPEQISGQPLDAKSDQFSFCVVLYEALYSKRPFPAMDLESLRANVARGEIAEPPRHASIPGWVHKTIERGLSVNPADRFADMGQLIAALSRDPTQRRRRLAAILAAVVLSATAGGLFAWHAVQPPNQERQPCMAAGTALDDVWNLETRADMRRAFLASGVPYAQEAWSHIDSRIADYISQLAHERRDSCQATRVRRDQDPTLFSLRAACLDRREYQVRALAETLTRADASTIEASTRAVVELADIAICRDTQVLLRGIAPPDNADLGERVAALRIDLARWRMAQLAGHLDQAVAQAGPLVQRAETIDYPPVHAEALFHLGGLELALGKTGDIERAEASLLAALDIAEAVGHDELVADIWLRLALLATRHHSEMSQAQRWARRALATSQRVADQGAREAQALMYRGVAHFRAGQLDRAEFDQRAAIQVAERSETDPLILADHYHNLANTLAALERLDETRSYFERAIVASRDGLGDEHPRVLRATHDYARFLGRIGEFDRSRELLEQVLDTRIALYGRFHVEVAMTHRSLANIEQQAGYLDRAEEHARASRHILERELAPDDARLAAPDNLLGIIQFRRGHHDQAIASYRRALTVYRAALGPEHENALLVESNIAEALVAAGRYHEALEAIESVERVVERRQIAHLPLPALTRKVRGLAYLGQGESASAIAPLSEALERLSAAARSPSERADVEWALARALRSSGRGSSTRWRELAESAERFHRARGRPGRAQAREIAAWLEATHP